MYAPDPVEHAKWRAENVEVSLRAQPGTGVGAQIPAAQRGAGGPAAAVAPDAQCRRGQVCAPGGLDEFGYKFFSTPMLGIAPGL